MRQWRWFLVKAFAVPGLPNADFKRRLAYAGWLWSRTAAVRFVESKPPSFWVKAIIDPTVKALGYPWSLQISVHPKVMKWWAGVSPEKREAMWISLLYHELFHIMGGPTAIHTDPAKMRAWVVKRYGPAPAPPPPPKRARKPASRTTRCLTVWDVTGLPNVTLDEDGRVRWGKAGGGKGSVVK